MLPPEEPRIENGALPCAPSVSSLPIISSLLEHAAAKAATSTNNDLNMYLFILYI
jgi:hypothetical protein